MKNLLQFLPKIRAGIFSIILLHILQPRAMAQGDQTSITITMNSWGGTTGAWLHLPDDYNSTTERYPLILFFHGVGEGGTDVKKVLVNGLPKAIANGAKMQFTVNGKLFKFIVVSAQASSGWMNAQGVDAVLEFIKSKYRIDESRVYLTGLSAGGYAAWNYVSAGSNYAQKIAAVVPVSAAGVDNEAGLCNFASNDVKLWTLCGSNDQFIDVVDKYLNIINACNPKTKAIKTITQGAGHTGSFWDQAYSVSNTYNNPNIYQWMLQYSRADVTNPTNTPPTANAGADATVTLPANASLDGSASKDADGSITTYAWTKVSGPSAGTITSAGAAKTTVTGLAAGTYVFRLTVTDNSGATGTDDVTITVKSATNAAPVANAGSNATITLPTSSTTLDGSASSDAEGAVTYSWVKTSGPGGGAITSPTSAKTSITGLVQGSYVYTLTVTDAGGLTNSASVTITVNAAAAVAPVAKVAASAINIQLPVNSATLDGSGSTGTITGFAWTKVSGPTGGAIASASSSTTSVSGLAAGTYVYRLTVTNSATGESTTADVTITVAAAASVPPVAKVAASAISIKLPTSTATLDGSSSTGTITGFAWTKVSGPAGGTISSAASSTTSITGLAAGTYVYRLTVTNSATGELATTNVTVTVTAAAAGDCGCKLTVSPGTDGGVYMDGSNKGLQPGDTICLKAGKYTYVEFFNFNGSAEKPLVFINCGGIVESGDGGDRGFSFRDSKFFKFTGSGTGDKYGFKANGGSKYIPSGFSAGRGSSDYEVERLEITKTEAGMLCKINPDCDPNSWYPNFAIRNLKFHDLYIHDVLGEGMYIGHTSQSGVDVTCNGVTESHPPPRIYNCKVYNVITENTGWDGIQVSGVPEGLEIYNNKVLNYGIENKGSQQAGIIFGGEGVGSIHDNLVSKGTGNGMQIFGSTHIDVYNNIVNEAGYDGTSAGQDAIFIDDKPTKQLYKPIQVYVFNNTIVKSKRAGIMFYNSQGTVASGNLFYNNLIVAPGSAATGDRKFLEIDRTIDYNSANNYYEADISKILFVNPAGNDFHLQAGSPAIDKGQDLTGYGITRDFDGDSRPYGAAFDAGADEFTGGTAPANKAPVANAGTDVTITLPTATTSLDGSGSTDSDGTITKYAWVKKSGPSAGAITTPAAAKTTLTSLAEGTYVFTLTVTDDKGATSSDDVTVTVKPAANELPVANAGPDVTITLPVSSASLDGSASADEDGSIASYAWVKKSGPATGTITTPAAAKTTLTGLTEGTYVFTLTVTDDKGATSTSDVTVTVKPEPNELPVANAGADVTITLPVSSASLDGSASSDEDGSIASYAWTKQSGPATGTIVSPSSAQTNINGLTEGFYVFRLTVTDNKGATHFDDVTITVNPEPANDVPVAKAGTDITITLPVNTASLDGSLSSDNDGSIVKYAWTKQSGPSGGTIATPAAAKTNITGLTEGTYVFRLTVTDDRDATAYDEVTITVNPEPANEIPVAKAGNDASVVLPVNSTSLDGGESVDNDGSIASYAWTKMSGPSGGTVASPNSAKTNITGLTEGTYVYRLTVTDNKGASAYDEVTITVKPPASNNDPVADAGADFSITLPTSSAALDGSASADSDGSITKYSWVKVSGPAGGAISSASSAKTSITGLIEGVYVYRLTVTDNNNATASDEITITVKPEVVNTPPIANAGSTITITLPTSSVTLDGSASYDAEASISSYQWRKVSGPTGGAIANSAGISTNVTGLTEGTYVFSLTVTDRGGLSNTATVSVVVNPAPNKPPVVNAGADITITLPVNSTTLDGSSSYDPDGTIVKYQWRKVSGPSSFAFANGSSAKTLLTNLAEGTYVFELTGTDNKGLSASDNVVVTVQATPNVAPVANAGSNIVITLPTAETTLNGSASTDADGTIVSYIWRQVYGPPTIIGATDAAVTSLGGLLEGTYTFELTVKDDKGASSSARVTITVNPAPNGAPVAKAGADKTVTLPVVAVELDGSASYDPDGTITQYSWKKISGPAEGAIVNGNSAKPTLVSLVPGEYEFELTVTDDKFETATDVVKVTVKDPDEEKMKVDLFPNPATTYTKVTVKAKELKDVTIMLYGSTGQLIRQMKLAELNGSWTQDINLDLLPCGMYVLKVTSGDYNYTKTFIKVAH